MIRTQIVLSFTLVILSNANFAKAEVQTWKVVGAGCVGSNRGPVQKTEGLAIQLDPNNPESTISTEDLPPHSKKVKIIKLNPNHAQWDETTTVFHKGPSLFVVKKILSSQIVERSDTLYVHPAICKIGDNLIINLDLVESTQKQKPTKKPLLKKKRLKKVIKKA